MVFAARRVSPTPALPTDPGYDPLQERRPQVLFADWTPRSLAPHDETVEVYSNCERVELFLNGKSLGAKLKPADDSPRNWAVPFESGTLRAVATNGGKVVATYELRTAGKPARVVLTADRTRLAPVWDDVSYVEATVVDANGVVVPDASDLITFKVTGPGRVAAVDSANNASHEPFQASERRAYQGRCFAIIKADSGKGRINVTASAAGLAGGSVTIEAVAPSAPKPAKAR
jgi:beta-galactosidase